LRHAKSKQIFKAHESISWSFQKWDLAIEYPKKNINSQKHYNLCPNTFGKNSTIKT
jgi:hypothetical protein